MCPGKAGFLINWRVIGAQWNLYNPSTNGVMVACYPPRSDWVTDQNVEVCCLTPALLKNMLENSYLYKKIPKILNQQIAQTLLFQMRYDSLPNSKKQPSDRQRGWCTPCFHITSVLLSPLLFLPELSLPQPKYLNILVCHSVTSWRIASYHNPICRGIIEVWLGTNNSSIY